MKTKLCLAGLATMVLMMLLPLSPASAACPSGTTDPNYCTTDATTTAATGVTDVTATLNGTLNDGNLASTFKFEYGTTTSYGTSTPTQNAAAGTADIAGMAAITGLTANTTYHFRISVTNTRGTVNGADMTFKTNAAGSPIAVTGAASAIANTAATLNGTVNPNGFATTYKFEYGTTTAYGTTTTAASAGAGTTPGPFSAAITGLTANTTYHFRITATNANGTSLGLDQTFTTSNDGAAGVPTVVTNAATLITSTSATLNGTVNPNGKATTYKFEYGTTTAYGTTSAAADAGSDSAVHAFTLPINGLTPSTTYHFRITATNANGTANGADLTFVTPAAATTGQVPTVNTGSCSNVTTTSITVGGTINPNGAASQVSYAYGLTTSYGSTTPAVAVPAGTATVAVPATISGLTPGAVYHFVIVGSNATGFAAGQDITCRAAPQDYTSDTTKVALRKVTLAAKPKRDKKKPYKYKTRGRIVPKGAVAANGCAGKVRVTLRHGKKIMARHTARVTKSCKYKSKFKVTRKLAKKFKLHKRGILRFKTRFLGNTVYKTKASKNVYVKYGKPKHKK